MSEGNVVKIENNTVHLIVLGTTPSFPQGVTLRPGLNTVPQFYMDEAEEIVIQRVPKGAKRDPKTKQWITEDFYPVKEAITELQRPVRFATADGWREGPQITIYAADQAPDRPDGPVPPQSLEHLREPAALKCIEIMNDAAVLKRWAKDSRPAVANFASSRINALR
jgi:hypothetical protein